MKWHPISTVPPISTVLLYRETDLYPVVGHADGNLEDFILEEGGCEGGSHRRYPFLHFMPTHWAELPGLPGPSPLEGR
ncbi:hypothetical protein LCGC14_1274820 [marine sediment metagenome]|uniref:Uncharacterized protein n=1 Tax=marine sediment metagenome TaxID=412755 RepID=A0A0F9LI85_9ZZZZ